ncbi:D(1) dopamine receptor-like [Diadema antillarum]|uniref:D(1) dopamine receptor-like n=1 Tax=Diadema antillarum TaxID=105358 RepID=UPI003A883450
MSLPFAVQIFLTLILMVVIVMALVGNAMVCLAVSRSRSLRSQVSNVFIVNLAITDMGCASLVMPFSLVSVWHDDWIFGGFLCDVACFFNYCFIIVSMLSLALISVDRHIYVVHPFRYTSLMMHRRAIVLVFCTWLVGFVFAAAPPLMRWVIYDNAEIICAINWESNHQQILAYTISAFVICFMSPIFVMVYSYVGIYKVANSHAKRIAPPQVMGYFVDRDPRNSPLSGEVSSYSQSEFARQENGHSPAHSTSRTPGRPRRQKKDERGKQNTPSFYSTKAIRSILVMILAYTICNTPFSLTKLIKVIKINNEAVPFYVNTAASWFGFINPCCNPIIYSITREDFRSAFIKLLPKCITDRLTWRADGMDNSCAHSNSPSINIRFKSKVQVKIIRATPQRSSPELLGDPQDAERTPNGSTENVNSNNGTASSADESRSKPNVDNRDLGSYTAKERTCERSDDVLSRLSNDQCEKTGHDVENTIPRSMSTTSWKRSTSVRSFNSPSCPELQLITDKAYAHKYSPSVSPVPVSI